MKFQISTLTALCAISAAKAEAPYGISEEKVINGESGLSIDRSGDLFVPRKILHRRQKYEEAVIGKTLKNIMDPSLNSDTNGSKAGLDLGILSVGYKSHLLHKDRDDIELSNGVRHLQGLGTWVPSVAVSLESVP